MPKTILTVVGARPQFIKCAPVSRAIRQNHDEIIAHTGQHYDYNMSQSFFEELQIPEPDYNLGIGSANHGAQTGRMLMALEKVMRKIHPDLVLIYGDTNSTMAGALAAAKLHIPVAHVEAGLRSFNRRMPEEINRIVADSLSDLLFAPTKTAVRHLASEGIEKGVHWVGDVMFDSFQQNLERIDAEQVLKDFNLQSKQFLLATVHRPQNTDSPATLRTLISSLENLIEPILFPIHPRTRNLMKKHNIESRSVRLRLVDPVSYQQMIALEKHARLIITDSGGVQKEAYFAGVPSIVLRTETEWVELVENGWAQLIGKDFERLQSAIDTAPPVTPGTGELYGDGHASRKIAELIQQTIG